MLDDHLESPVTRRRLRAGPAAPYLDAFADWLHANGYRAISISTNLRALARFTDWLRDERSGAGDLVGGLAAYREHLRRRRRLLYADGALDSAVAAASLLVRFLRERGVVATPPTPSALDAYPLLAEFSEWMVRNRGVVPSTVEQYGRTVAELIEALGEDPARYSAGSLRTFVLGRVRGHGVSLAICVAGAVRAFLRFLVSTKRCAAGTAHAIPDFAGPRRSTTPRFMEPADLERVVAACTGRDPCGVRDRAVILLLARLGLRASDVAGLSFADLDWKSGRLSVMGKSRRQEWLPLPQAVGDAVLQYLRSARPPLASTRVFTTVNAPIRPLTRAAVTYIARCAIRRAGVHAPSNGAHVFRHSAATAMLRSGASLAGVGAVLRHRSPSTTAHYAKVDFALLLEIAQPWPEVSPC